MREKLFVTLAAALAIGLTPAVALAEPTLSPNTVTSSVTATATVSGTPVSANVSCKAGDEGTKPYVKVESTTEEASNTPAGANVVASFVITHQNTLPPYTFSYDLGTEYAGAKVTVYIQHEDGTTEVVERTADSNGTISFEQDKLSIHTIVADKTEGAAPSTDAGATSPYTGVPTALVAGVTAISVVSATGVAVALRKKVSE